jgi:diguanylate cyclase (GGDEF)-like protein/putative nucleotidyltransferase with HDIG domain
VLLFSGSSTSPYLLFYMWVAFYAFYFLPERQALALAAFTVASYAAVVLAFRAGFAPSPGANSNEDVSALVLLAGTVVVAGAFIVLLRDRVGRLIRQLTEAASTDPLTGLLNRRAFGDALEHELARSERNGQPFSLLVGDCDFFKDLNDALGRHAGDDALEAIGHMIERDRRRIDVAARTGGEEFGMILPETDQHEAYLVAERLRMGLPDLGTGGASNLTMSFGVATYPTHADDADGLLRAADDALYAAKALGRDRSVLHSNEIAGILASGREGKGQRDKAQLATVLNLAEALDMRDSGTARHSQTVGRYCEAMARQLDLPREKIDRMRVAGILHDIGKIGVADSILCKPGPLTDDEYDAMKKHPEIGARILGGSNLDDIREWVLAHHERPDGRGYPLGLSGEEIPIEARILAVADAYEAMTSDRVYRPAIGAYAAREELLKWSGQQFDSDVVAAFLRALEDEAGSRGATGVGRT